MKIKIKNLKLTCIIGILDFEREKEQKVIINLSFKYNYKKGNFIDYAQVEKFLVQTMKRKKFGLIEDAILYFEKKLYKMYKITKLKISICKPDIINSCKVIVTN